MYSLCPPSVHKCPVQLYFPGNLFMKTKLNKLTVLKGLCLYWRIKTAQRRVRTRVTGVEAKGIMGRRKTAFYFPPSSARKFSSRERRLGTRQNKRYSNSLMISIPTELFYLGVIPSVANFLLDFHNSLDHILRLSTIAFCLPLPGSKS